MHLLLLIAITTVAAIGVQTVIVIQRGRLPIRVSHGIVFPDGDVHTMPLLYGSTIVLVVEGLGQDVSPTFCLLAIGRGVGVVVILV